MEKIIKEMNEKSAELNLVEILRFIGDDPEREGLKETPKRMVKSCSRRDGILS